MPQYEFIRIERVIATWTVEAATIEEAREKWEEEHKDVVLACEQVTDVYESYWKAGDGTRFEETAEEDEEEEPCLTT